MTEATSPAFPETDVTILNGEHVIIRPWSLALGRLMRKRIGDLVVKVQGAKDGIHSLNDLLENCEGEIIQIIAETIGKDDQWMNDHLAYEDLITLAQAIIATCINRPDGGGVAGKLVGAATAAGTSVPGVTPEMAARMEEVRQAAAGPVSTPTTSTLPAA